MEKRKTTKGKKETEQKIREPLQEKINRFCENKTQIEEVIFRELLRKHLPAIFHESVKNGKIIIVPENEEWENEKNKK
jgi:hypothetical protein